MSLVYQSHNTERFRLNGYYYILRRSKHQKVIVENNFDSSEFKQNDSRIGYFNEYFVKAILNRKKEIYKY